MAEDLDVEAMLEAPYMYKKEEAAPENGAEAKDTSMEEEPPAAKKKEERRRSRSRSKGRKRSRSKSRERHRDRKDRDRGKDKDRERDRDRDRDRDRGERDRDRDRSDRKDRDRDRDRERRRSPVRRRSRSRERYGGYRGGGDRWGGGGYRGGRGYRDREEDNYRSRRSRSKERNKDVSPVRDDPDADTRDARTVFVMQLSQRARERELKEFFSAVGKVRTVKIITDRNSRRSKGVGYVEYDSADSVPLALGLNNQKLLGVPIIVQPSHAEKNRSAGQNVTLQKVNSGPMRLYVGSLHYNITEAMLRGIFEPFGKIDNIQLMMDTDANRSKGYGFITFHDAEDAKRALDQLNGFELAGRPMKVNHVTERNEQGQQAPSFLDSEELDKRGITLNTTGRLQLMAKLAEGTGFQIPAAAAEALHPLSQVPGLGLPGIQINPNQVTLPPAGMNLQESLQAAQLQAQQSAQALAAATASAQQTNLALGMGAIPDVLSGIPPLGPGLLPEPVPQPPPPPVAQVPAPAPPAPAAAPGGPTGAGSTACFMLSNMFDPQAETMLGWETDIRDDVIEECNKHGGVLHIHVDKASPQGNVYVKCPTAQIAMAAVNNLHNRWFAGKMITAAYMPVANYHAIFPPAASATMLLQPSTPRRV